MKYRMTDNKNNFIDIKEGILARRGIENPYKYLNTLDSNILSYSFFGNSIEEAYSILKNSIENNEKIKIYSDPDADGMFSSAMLYLYIKKVFGINLEFYIHSSKQHGLSDKELFLKVINDVKSGNLNLLLIPDSSTNDYREAKILSELNCKTIIFDHHIVEKEKNKHSIIINPQLLKNYPNLDSSGTLVTWKFLKAIDDFEWVNYADDYLDLVAYSIISDGMDIKNIENRHLITLGLSNIKNKFISEMIDKDYRIKNHPPTIIDISFYIVPQINGIIRSGSEQDKEIMFNALCEKEEFFDYEKRDKSIIKESIYERAIRLCINSKSRQDRAVSKSMESVITDIELNKRNNNKILFALADENVDKNFTGLICQKLTSAYGKPCILLRENENNFFSGSARNLNDSPLTNLKSFLESIGYLNWAKGHEQAFGLSLTKSQLIKTIELSNEKLADYDFTPIHLIDYEFDFSNPLSLSTLNKDFLLSLYELRYYWGQGISEAKILLKNIEVNSSTISFFGAREKSEIKNNWKFELQEGIDIINFRADGNDIIYKKYGSGNSDGFNWDGDNLSMDVICKVARTEYNGEQRWAFIVEEMELHD